MTLNPGGGSRRVIGVGTIGKFFMGEFSSSPLLAEAVGGAGAGAWAFSYASGSIKRKAAIRSSEIPCGLSGSGSTVDTTIFFRDEDAGSRKCETAAGLAMDNSGPRDCDRGGSSVVSSLGEVTMSLDDLRWG